MLIPNHLGAFPTEKAPFVLSCCTARDQCPPPPPKEISINPVPWWGHFTPFFFFLHVKKWKCCPTGALNGCRRCMAQGPSDDLILLDVYCLPASFGLQLEHHSVTSPPRLDLSYVRAPLPKKKDWCVCVFNCHFHVSSRHIFLGDICCRWCIAWVLNKGSLFASSEYITCVLNAIIIIFCIVLWVGR